MVPSKVWVATRSGACPQCGHGQFSISFPPLAGRAVAAEIAALDAHGRRRKTIRLEDLTGGAAAATAQPAFKARMRAYTRAKPAPHPHEDEA